MNESKETRYYIFACIILFATTIIFQYDAYSYRVKYNQLAKEYNTYLNEDLQYHEYLVKKLSEINLSVKEMNHQIKTQ